MNLYNNPLPPRQFGLTIVEMMIALLLGTGLLVIAFNLYYSTKQAEHLATSVLQTQTEARNALHLIRQSIEHAGYISDIANNPQREQIFPASGPFAKGEVIRISGSGDNQHLLVRLQGDSRKPLRACNGDIIPPVQTTAAQETWIEFSVVAEQLRCQVYQNGALISDAMTIASPVAALRLRAFTKTTANAQPTTHIYDNTTALANNEIVKGVQVQLVTRSRDRIRRDDRLSSLPLTGFNDLQFADQYFYINSNQFFVTENL